MKKISQHKRPDSGVYQVEITTALARHKELQEKHMRIIATTHKKVNAAYLELSSFCWLELIMLENCLLCF